MRINRTEGIILAIGFSCILLSTGIYKLGTKSKTYLAVCNGKENLVYKVSNYRHLSQGCFEFYTGPFEKSLLSICNCSLVIQVDPSKIMASTPEGTK